MDKKIIVSIALLLGFSGCAGVRSETSWRQFEYRPILDDYPEQTPFGWRDRWKDLPEDPPGKPLPFEPLTTETD